MAFSRTSVAGLDDPTRLAEAVEKNLLDLETSIFAVEQAIQFAPRVFAYNTQNGAVATAWAKVPFDVTVVGHEDFMAEEGSDEVIMNFSGLVSVSGAVSSTSTSGGANTAHIRPQVNGEGLDYGHGDAEMRGSSREATTVLSEVVIRVSKGDKLSIGFYHSSAGGLYIADGTYMGAQRVG